MEIFCVGGAVRDELLGRPVSDRDWVVVGATPEAMQAQGFRPVGRDFPVFLHPHTHEEYALARTERKVARGYRGFAVHSSPDVTLEEDLRRRDLTINAMARSTDGRLIDPWGGEADLQAKKLRHVSEAFAEDPVRILRLARFAARFADFSVEPETMALAQRMVAAGEADALVAERVWQEFARGLMEAAPSRMLTVLAQSGALTRILPELCAVDARAQREWNSLLAQLDGSAREGDPLPVRYALVCGWPGARELARQVTTRLRAPSECAELACLVAEHGMAHPLNGSAPTLARRLEQWDALRRPQRARQFVSVCARRDEAEPLAEVNRFEAYLAAVRAVDAGAIAADVRREHPEAPDIALRIRDALHRAREASLEASLGAITNPHHTAC